MEQQPCRWNNAFPSGIEKPMRVPNVPSSMWFSRLQVGVLLWTSQWLMFLLLTRARCALVLGPMVLLLVSVSAKNTDGTQGQGVPPHDSASDSDGGLGEIAGSMYTEMPWARTQTEHDKTTQKTSLCRRLSPTHKAENAWKSAWSP